MSTAAFKRHDVCVFGMRSMRSTISIPTALIGLIYKNAHCVQGVLAPVRIHKAIKSFKHNRIVQ